MHDKNIDLWLETMKISCLIIKSYIKSQQRFKSDYHEEEEVSKIPPSSNDDKRLQTFDKVITYPYGTNAFIVCESGMMTVRDFFVKNYVDCPFYDQIISHQR